MAGFMGISDVYDVFICAINDLRQDGEIDFNTIPLTYTLCPTDKEVQHFLYTNGEKKDITSEITKQDNVIKYKATGLSHSTSYTFQIGVVIDGKEFKSNKTIIETARPIIYGVKVDENNSNPATCCTYTRGAVGITPANSTGLGGWADKFPFKDIKLVGLKNGRETGDINPYKKTHYLNGQVVPQDVDIMVKIPRIYYGIKTNSNGYEVIISDLEGSVDDITLLPVAYMAIDTESSPLKYIYVGAYLGYEQNSKLRSISGVEPDTYSKIRETRVYAENNGQGYKQLNWHVFFLLQILYLMAYKNLNCQEALGYGYTDYNNESKINTGGTNTKGMIYGSSNRSEQMCFLGIEDLWGNLMQWVDGVYIEKDGSLKIQYIDREFNDYGNGYPNMGNVTSDILNGIPSKMEKRIFPYGFIPSKVSASTNTYYCDNSVIYVMKACCFGGRYYNLDGAGIFNLEFYYNFNEGNATVSSRLCYLDELRG